MRLLRDSLFFAVSLNHLFVDILNGQTAIVLVFLSPILGLSNADIGLIITIYITAASLAQPLFGWLADRYAARWLGAGGLLWMAGWFAAALLVAGQGSLPLLVIGGLGSGVFHPTGTERATARGRILMAGRAATAASIFFLFGQVGLSIGPAIGGALLDGLGLSGILILCALAVPVALNLLFRSRTVSHSAGAQHSESASDSSAAPQRSFRMNWWLLSAFALLVMTRTAPQTISVTFIPKLLQDQGYAPTAYGAIASLFMAGAAIGGVAGGALADRCGRRPTILWTLLASVAPFYFYPVTAGVTQYLLVFLAGALSGASHSVLVVLAQALMPRRMALASGLTLGFMFASGSLGAYVVGLLADVYPLGAVLQLNAALAIAAALLSLTLRRDRPAPVPAPVGG